MHPDSELLDQYRRGSSEAFAELVRRHVHWVHAVTKRRLGDAHLAEDATQATFSLLARKKPRLNDGSPLSPWLFTVAGFACKQVQRSEYRRRVRETEAAKMRQQWSDSTEGNWNDLSPLLDELVSRLRRGDRQAILLRFYEQKSYPQIGESLRISEDAARKRVSRAVEQLRGMFSRRGVTVGAAALASAMSAHVATQSASASVIASASAGSSQTMTPLLKAMQSMLFASTIKPIAALLSAVLLIGVTTAALMQMTSPPVTATAAAPATAPATIAPAKLHYGVVLSPSGTPIPNAKISLIRWEHAQIAIFRSTLTTDAQGKFQSPVEPADQTPYFVVQAPGFAINGGGFFNDSEFDPAEVQLSPPGRLRVRFVDPLGNPVVGMTVAPIDILIPPGTLTILPREIQDELAQTTDADGVCTFTSLGRGTQMSLEVRDPRFAHPRFSGRTKMTSEELTDTGTIRLEPASSISGKMIDSETGKPASGVWISVVPSAGGSGNEGNAITDDSGFYRVAQLCRGEYYIRPDARDQHLKDRAVISYRKIPVGGGEDVTNKDMPLIVGGTVRGRVFAAQTNRGVANATLIIAGSPEDPQRTSQVYAYSDANGDYTAHVPPGRQTIITRFLSLGSGGELREPDRESTGIEVAKGQTVTQDFPLQPTPGQPLRGKVVDPQGHPIAGAFVTAEPQVTEIRPARGRSSPTLGYATSDENGAFTIFGAADGDLLRARKGSRWMTTESLAVTSANRNSLTLIMSKAQWAGILIRVQRPDGSVLTGAKVQVIQIKGNDMSSVVKDNLVTSADGSCLIEQLYPDATYTVRISTDKLSLGLLEGLVVAPNKTLEPPPVKLEPADSFVAGMVVNSNNEPIGEIEVRVEGTRTASQETRTDLTGRFRFDSIVAGDTVKLYAFRPAIRGRTEQITSGTDNAILVFRTPSP